MQKSERLNAADRLIAQGIGMAEAAMSASMAGRGTGEI